MVNSNVKNSLLLTLVIMFYQKCCAIRCYQCSASKSIDCSDEMIHLGGIQPESCDHVFEAGYCVKSTSLDGGYAPKRYCSSLDLGNYCNYVRQPGDVMSYRSCLYTCTGDGCNSSYLNRPMKFHSFVIFSYFIIKLNDFSFR